ncbi:TPA: prolyl oligopeptidase family serine peptidase [Legionella pneumophila]|nr:prolyl oligopeptidase family serine peptidase [Legionella pneumophila]
MIVMKEVCLGLIICLVVFHDGWAGKRLPELNDLYRIQDISEPDLSPDGKWVAYTVSQLNAKDNISTTEVWKVSVDSKSSQRITFAEDSSSSLPKWSPNGKWLAYLSDGGKEGTTQIWIASVQDNKEHQLTHIDGEVSDFTWSPDSNRIVFIAQKSDPSNEEEQPIVVDRYQFKVDGVGYLGKGRDHLYLVELKSKAITQLTDGNHDEYLPAWSPDGKYIAFVTKRGKDPDRHFNYDIYLIEPKSGAKEHQLTHFPGSDMNPDYDSNLSWSPDSSKIAYLRSNEHQWTYYSPNQLAIIDINTKDEKIIAPRDNWYYKPKWSQDGKFIYALIEESRNTYLNRIDIHSGQIKKLTGGLRYDMDYSLAKGKIILLTTDDTHPSELFILNSGLIPLTQHNQKLLDEVKFQPAEDIQCNSFDGTRVDGLLMKPAEYQPGILFPGFVYLHGGPVYQFSHEFNFDMQWIAANNYAVIAPNPRGSSGRGFHYAKAIFADWGNLDVKDILASVDYVIGKGMVDPNRLGIGGWSYGGMLTNYVIATDSRFKAAISGAGAANILAGYGVDQYTPEYELELGKPWTNPELYLKLSYPFLKANNIKTPTLFLCSGLDFNVPCVGSEQLYQALKSLDVPTQLVIYPNEYHTLEKPSFVIDRLKRYTNWLDTYVK